MGVGEKEKATSVRSGVDGSGANGHGDDIRSFEFVTKPKPRPLLALFQQPSSQSPQQGHLHRQSTASIYSDETSTSASLADQGPPYPLHNHLTHPYLLHSGAEGGLRAIFTGVGYGRWVWGGREGGRGVGVEGPKCLPPRRLHPTHEYASIAEVFIAQHAPEGSNGVVPPSLRLLRSLAASCRSFTRLVLRLREQAEADLKEWESVGLGSGSAPTSSRERDGRRTSMQSVWSSGYTVDVFGWDGVGSDTPGDDVPRE
ncbi:hypothetical protein M422DRAFT_259009 [Sphaerobolus stellatus SS14]|uniref:Uncharacterized protein n=1 Tax=Sphaerobolus stellatus (strain SS14) TaxID=990650 RepID=A0A0C9VLD2_SPHS4|nr:hypothetical protein M422DRAFT_259009 [Sphaerobolus stellatus SS14]